MSVRGRGRAGGWGGTWRGSPYGSFSKAVVKAVCTYLLVSCDGRRRVSGVRNNVRVIIMIIAIIIATSLKFSHLCDFVL